jgi:hypothetical protein
MKGEMIMPQTVKIRESKQEGARTITVIYEFGKEVDDLVRKFGPEVVFNAAVDALTRDIRAIVRARLKAGESDEQIQVFVDSWKPVSRVSNEKVSRLGKLLAKCTEEDMVQIRKFLASQEQPNK